MCSCGIDKLDIGRKEPVKEVEAEEPVDLPAIEVPVEVSKPKPKTVEDPRTEPEPVSVTVSMAFAGDIAFDDRYANMNSLRQRGSDITQCIDPSIIERMNAADICMINNEFPYSDRGTPTAGKKFTFRAKPETVEYLKVLGTDIVGLANNHAYDYGPDALMDTFDTLKEAGIPYVGAGRNIDEAAAPYYIEAKGVKIGFACATQIERSLPPDTKEATADSPGVLRTLDPARFVQTIEEAEANSDLTVVFVHWGSENVNDAEEAQRELAREYVKAGADLIIGAHPHVLQGFEYVDGVPVMYSLGNFWFNSKTLDNCIVEAEVTSDESGTYLTKLRFVPCVQKGCYTHGLEKGSSEYKRVLNFERKLSYDVTIDDDGYLSDGATEYEEDTGEITQTEEPAAEEAPVMPETPPEPAVTEESAASENST